MSDVSIVFLAITVWATFGIGNVMLARRRALRYFRSAGFTVVQLKLMWGHSDKSPLQHSVVKMTFYAHLQDAKGNPVPAWVSSAGIFALVATEPLDVKFSPTGAFPGFPAL